MTEIRPKLRPLDAVPTTQEARPLILLSDPSGFSSSVLTAAPQWLPLLQLLNGQNTLSDLQKAYERATGVLLPRAEVDELLRLLDEALFLDNSHFRREQQRMIRDYRSSPVRPAAHAGQSYPADPGLLLDTLHGFYTDPQGAGIPQGRRGSRVRAAVVPHIDLRLGGPVYTHSYRRIAEGCPPDLFVVLGTGHRGLPDCFSISKKAFATPLGEVPFAQEFSSAFERALGRKAYPEDFSHRREHTIEFQVLFLQHLFGGRIPLFPVLTSFAFGDLLDEPPEAPGPASVTRFVEALTSAEESTGLRVCYLASVDLAHVGPAYGDNFRPDEGTIRSVIAQDAAMLRSVIEADAGAFLRYVTREKDCRRICGFPAIYTLLHLLSGLRGELLCHDYARMDAHGSFVTYASLTFETPVPEAGAPRPRTGDR